MDDPRTRILDAAERAFAKGGLAGARVAGIAQDAGVNKAMLYYYFHSKEDLYRAVLERVFEQVVAMATAVHQDRRGDEAASLLRFVDGYRAILAAHPEFPRLIVRVLVDGHEDLANGLLPKFSRVLPLIASLVARGQQDGTVNRALDPLVTPPALVAPVVFFALAGPMLAQVVNQPSHELSARWFGNLSELLAHGLVARHDPLLAREEER